MQLSGDLATGYLGDFKAGEQVVFWIRTTTGETLVSNFFWNQNLVQQSQYVSGTDHDLSLIHISNPMNSIRNTATPL